MTMPITLGPLVATLLVAYPSSSSQDASVDEGARFAAPILLTSGEKALGEGLPFPSPRLHDIDGDGDLEMVLGDLRGRVHVAEKVAGEDANAWGELRPFLTGERTLKFNNW